MPHSLILLVGYDPMVLETRSSDLRSAGYLVEAVQSVSQAFRRFQNGDFYLVVLCHSIPPTERDQLTVAIRASGARTPILLVSPFSEGRGFANAVIDSDPKKLLQGIEMALQRAAAHISSKPQPKRVAASKRSPAKSAKNSDAGQAPAAIRKRGDV